MESFDSKRLTIANSNSRCINKAPIGDHGNLCLDHEKMQTKRLNMWNLEACKGSSRVKHKLELDKNGNILTSFKLTQLKKYSKLLNLRNSEVLKDKILNSVIRYST